MKKSFSILVVKGHLIELNLDELEYELNEILQDDFDFFECAIADFHKKHGFLPEEAKNGEETEEGKLYWEKYLPFTDKLRKRTVRSMLKAIQKLIPNPQ